MPSSARIDELQKKFNENPRRYFAPLADEYRKAGDLQAAIELCRTHLAQQPGHMSGHIVLGKALYENGEMDEARGTFETALGLDPENLIALRHLGDIARQQGDVAGARAWYQRVLDADPRNDEIAEQMAALDAGGGPVGATEVHDPVLPAPLAEAPDTLAESTVPDGTLPPALEPAAIAYLAEEPTLEVPAYERRAPEPMDLDLDALDAPPAAPPPAPAAAAPAAPANDLGLESMEFVAPSGEDRASQAEGLERPEYDFDPHVVDGSVHGEATPAAFVTETMAELYLQQGFRDEALQVYRQLLEANPADENLRARVQQLETGGRSTLAFEVSEDVVRAAQERHARATRRSARRFFASLAARRAPMREGGSPMAGMDADHADAAPGDALPADGFAYGPTGVDTSAMDAQAFVAPHTGEPGHETPLDGWQGAAAAEATHEWDTREFETTSDAAPAPDAPGYEAQAYEGQGWDQQPEGAQGYEAQAYESPSYETQGYESQGHDSLGYDAAAPEAGAGDVPAWDGGVGETPAPEGAGDAYDPYGTGAAPEPAVANEFDVAAYETATWEGVTGDEAPPAPAEPPPARGMTPSGGQRDVTGTVDALFGGTSGSAEDEAAAAALASVFTGTPAAIPAVRPARSELSLDQVFRDTPRRSDSQRRESSAFSFDQFFSEPTGAQGGEAAPPAPPQPPAGEGGENDEQFNAWLEGLKQK